MFSSKSVVLNWRVHFPRGASINFKEGTSPCVFCNMESLINKLTNKYICICNLFVVRGA